MVNNNIGVSCDDIGRGLGFGFTESKEHPAGEHLIIMKRLKGNPELIIKWESGL